MAKIIVIDPGHGGSKKVAGSDANNSKGPDGLLEKEMAFIISVKMAEILTDKKINVYLTRNDDVNLSLKDRANIGLEKKADVFVSIHFNGDEDPKVQGTETWVHIAASKDSKLLASSIQQKLLTATEHKNRGVKAKSLDVLDLKFHYANTASCLVEVSYISNPEEEKRLKKEKYQKAIAKAIVNGITDFLNNSSSIEVFDVKECKDSVCGD